MDEAIPAVEECEKAANKLKELLSELSSWMRAKGALAKSFGKSELTAPVDAALKDLGKKVGDVQKRLPTFVRETGEHKVASIMLVARDQVSSVEKRMKTYQKTVAKLELPAMQEASSDSIKETVEKLRAAEKDTVELAQAAHKVIAEKQKEAMKP